MFSTMPKIGTPSRSNIPTAFVASSMATFCGVETMTAPAIAASWAIDIEASEVPGGRSTIR